MRLITDDLRPATVQYVNPDGAVEDGRLFMRFDGEFGTDRLLGGGETSDAKPGEYAVGNEHSFSVTFSIEQESVGGTISGVVFEDTDEDGVRDRGEPGLAGRFVTLNRVDQPSTQPVHQTDVTGAYEFVNLVAGIYELSVAVSPDLLTTTNPIRVVLIEDQDGTVGDYLNADFGVRRAGVVAG